MCCVHQISVAGSHYLQPLSCSLSFFTRSCVSGPASVPFQGQQVGSHCWCHNCNHSALEWFVSRATAALLCIFSGDGRMLHRFARREAGKRVKGYSATDLAAILGGGASEMPAAAAPTPSQPPDAAAQDAPSSGKSLTFIYSYSHGAWHSFLPETSASAAACAHCADEAAASSALLLQMHAHHMRSYNRCSSLKRHLVHHFLLNPTNFCQAIVRSHRKCS